MNRIIKFRAKRTDNNEWIFGSLAFNDNRPYIVGGIIESDSEYILMEYWWPVKAETVGQFTGLKDANGTDIYEGDVLKGTLSYEGFTLPTMGVVEYSEQYAAFCLRNDAGQTLLQHHLLSALEVIGNIHEEAAKEAPYA